MGNVFQRLSLVSAAVLFFSACGGSSATDSSSSGPPPFSGTLSAAPSSSPPTAPAASNAESSATASPSTGTAANGEAPAAGPDTPLVPATGAAPSNPASAPTTPAATPPATGSDQTAAQTPPADPTPAQTPPATGKTQVFLLFGQSNMWGVPNPQQQDLTINPKVEVLTITTCSKHGTNQWVPAQPPLHGCVGQVGTGGQGPGVGPGDYFGRTIAAAFPNDTILLVPAAVPGVSIDTFMPGQQNYTNLLSRAKMAQQRGTISGMIFHQGESDSGGANANTWPTRVKTVVDRLRSDLGIGTVPFVAGELLYKPAGCCGDFNTLVNQLPNVVTNAAVASANGLTTVVPKSADTYGNLHFDVTAQRTFGVRYGEAMLKLLGNN